MISIRIAVRRRRIANKIERRRQCPKRKENENAQQTLHVASLKINSSKLTCELGLLLFHTTGLLSCYPVLSPIWDGRQDNNSHHRMPVNWLSLTTEASKDPLLGSSEGLLWLGTLPYQDLV